MTAEARAAKAIQKVAAGQALTPEQRKWLDLIGAHLAKNLSLEREDFEWVPVLSEEGGWGAAKPGPGVTAGVVQILN